MRGAERRLQRDLQHARAEGYTMAAKLVRGAYVVGEAERSASTGVPYPLLPHKDDTDAAYDRAVSVLLRAIADDAATDGTVSGVGDVASAACLVATHNRPSVEAAVRQMEALGLRSNHPRVHFAQILGMCDMLTLALGQAGFNSHKLVLFGDFDEVFPWLLRRLDENRDMMGAAQLEVPAIRQELARRLRPLG